MKSIMSFNRTLVNLELHRKLSQQRRILLRMSKNVNEKPKYRLHLLVKV